jgi:hypothetical protein
MPALEPGKPIERELAGDAVDLYSITLEQYISLGDVAKTEQAAKEKDASRVVEYLKSAGKLAFDVSTKIGVSLAPKVSKQSVGIM